MIEFDESMIDFQDFHQISEIPPISTKFEIENVMGVHFFQSIMTVDLP